MTAQLRKLHEKLLFMRNSGLELIDNCLCPRQWRICVFQENSPKPAPQTEGSARWCAEVGGWFTDTHCAASSHSLCCAQTSSAGWSNTTLSQTPISAMWNNTMQQVWLNVGPYPSQHKTGFCTTYLLPLIRGIMNNYTNFHFSVDLGLWSRAPCLSCVIW